MTSYKVCYGSAFYPAPHKADDWPKCLNHLWMVGTVDKLNNVIYVLGTTTSENVSGGLWCSVTIYPAGLRLLGKVQSYKQPPNGHLIYCHFDEGEFGLSLNSSCRHFKA